ncbi:hypothetical protein GE21DRAFT_1061 [Neurospora crassa]|uniref:Uncharacterized protein n=1 Tax=Neurospora crassa (strain ATCC 24698 / 74-OR23-1A / CBS 708.71 / DSM 1257 / FGSC 987) TaxID=367110 RepID=V5IQX6_NEUCR|nr:hypothetical protein NCU16382 [Neurospora crassa OR74A]ESA44004.1 hypothetical protein NCU16382 [Neurospora crassa OR74A]KHE83262.1 hypothetical protein GE21DRAFT_1061 [Neurospora crassa]|eukprot:XP_011393375.1 hypothetical protein NCU16382 [Neurospora crassa OR74A]
MRDKRRPPLPTQPAFAHVTRQTCLFGHNMTICESLQLWSSPPFKYMSQDVVQLHAASRAHWEYLTSAFGYLPLNMVIPSASNIELITHRTAVTRRHYTSNGRRVGGQQASHIALNRYFILPWFALLRWRRLSRVPVFSPPLLLCGVLHCTKRTPSDGRASGLSGMKVPVRTSVFIGSHKILKKIDGSGGDDRGAVWLGC